MAVPNSPINQPMTHDGGGSGATSGWMNIPQVPMNYCPQGLEYLTTIDQLFVHQKYGMSEDFPGYESNNKFTVKNNLEEKVYYAIENSDSLSRGCFRSERSFNMNILDKYKNEVIHLYRPLDCNCCGTSSEHIEVSLPSGAILGIVDKEWSMFHPAFAIKNANRDTVLRIKGPLCLSSCCDDIDFKIKSPDGSTQVGKISRQWLGLFRELFTDSDYFGITFPIDLDVQMKAVLLGACFLIKDTCFERERNHVHLLC